VAHELRQDQKNAGKSLMAEGQRGRKIGSGMKTLWNKRVKPQKLTKKMTRQSTNEGQPDPTLEPVLEHEEGNKTSGNLEVGRWAIRDIAERLESTGIVAHDGDLEAAMYRAPRSWSHCPQIPDHSHCSFPNFGVAGWLSATNEQCGADFLNAPQEL
jgi:hypothetical protein